MLLLRLWVFFFGGSLLCSQAMTQNESGALGRKPLMRQSVVSSPPTARNQHLQDNLTLTLETCPILIAEIALTCFKSEIHTCARKCGSYHYRFSGMVCSCDVLCQIYDDCCWDFQKECPDIFKDARSKKSSYPDLMITCAPVDRNYYFFVHGCLNFPATTTSTTTTTTTTSTTATSTFASGELPFVYTRKKQAHVHSKVTNLTYWNLQSFLCGEGDHPHKVLWDSQNLPTVLRKCENMVSFNCVADHENDPLKCVWNNNLHFELGRICSLFSEESMHYYMRIASTERTVVAGRQIQEPKSDYWDNQVTADKATFNLRESTYKQMCFLNAERNPLFREFGNIARIRDFGTSIQMDSAVANYIWGQFFCGKNEKAHGGKCIQSKLVIVYLNYFYDPGICPVINLRNVILRRILLLNVNGLKLTRRHADEQNYSRSQGLKLSFEVTSKMQNISGNLYLDKELGTYLKTSAPKWLNTTEVCVQFVDYSCKIIHTNPNKMSDSKATPDRDSSLYDYVDCETLRQYNDQELTAKPVSCESENLYLLLICFPNFKDEIFQGWNISALTSAQKKFQRNVSTRARHSWILTLAMPISVLAELSIHNINIIH